MLVFIVKLIKFVAVIAALVPILFLFFPRNLCDQHLLLLQERTKGGVELLVGVGGHGGQVEHVPSFQLQSNQSCQDW